MDLEGLMLIFTCQDILTLLTLQTDLFVNLHLKKSFSIISHYPFAAA